MPPTNLADPAVSAGNATLAVLQVLGPGGTVDPLSEQIRVPVMPGVLLDHVDHDPPQGERPGRVAAKFPGLNVQARRSRDDLPRPLDLACQVSNASAKSAVSTSSKSLPGLASL
jgi:hypothetical protein